MSDLIRNLLSNPVYRRGQPTKDERSTPFLLPAFKTPQPQEIPEVKIEGVPPVGKPPEDRARKHTIT